MLIANQLAGQPVGFDFSAFRVKRHTHFRIRFFYCKSPVPHEGSCPMVLTLSGKLWFRLKFGFWA